MRFCPFREKTPIFVPTIPRVKGILTRERIADRKESMKWLSLNRDLAGLALLAASLLGAESFCQTPDPNFHIYLAFGQSNMEGFPGTIESQDQTVNARFKMMAAIDWPDKSRVKGSWYNATPPLCRNGNGLNPCDYFGRTLADSLPPAIKIGIINVAVAGCAIEMFDKDKYQSYVAGEASWMQSIATGYGGNPYARLVELGKQAQKEGVIKGILFHQGESGSKSGNWANEVKLVYTNLITELGLTAANTPFIAGDLVNPSKMVQDLPKTLPNSYVASSQGLEHQSDNLHFKAAGYRELGKRYAAIMLSLYAKSTGLRGNAPGTGYRTGPSFDDRSGPAWVGFSLPRSSFVSLKAYNPAGRELAVLASGNYAPGSHAVRMASRGLPAGLAILRMDADGASDTREIRLGAE